MQLWLDLLVDLFRVIQLKLAAVTASTHGRMSMAEQRLFSVESLVALLLVQVSVLAQLLLAMLLLAARASASDGTGRRLLGTGTLVDVQIQMAATSALR